MAKARITGLGAYLPKKVLSNSDLEKMVDTNDEWIRTRTGMQERRLAEADEFTSDMGYEAAKKALVAAQIEPSAIDMIIVATMTPDYITPSTAAIIQAKLGATNAAAIDIQAACTGFLYGLAQAKAFIEAGMYKNVLLIASEKLSSFVDYKDRNTCILFGDGASAVVVSGSGEGLAIGQPCLGADGEQIDLLLIPGGGTRNPCTKMTLEQGLHTIKMAGNEVFKHAVRRMTAAARQCLDLAGLKDDAISWFVPHQANMRIITSLAEYLNVPQEKVYVTIHKYGNTSASSVAIALTELVEEKPLVEGENLLLVGFGAGLTWGSILLTKIKK
jgi:3-oxoacyl-[acyl-carrier-protein] synthase-3